MMNKKTLAGILLFSACLTGLLLFCFKQQPVDEVPSTQPVEEQLVQVKPYDLYTTPDTMHSEGKYLKFFRPDGVLLYSEPIDFTLGSPEDVAETYTLEIFRQPQDPARCPNPYNACEEEGQGGYIDTILVYRGQSYDGYNPADIVFEERIKTYGYHYGFVNGLEIIRSEQGEVDILSIRNLEPKDGYCIKHCDEDGEYPPFELQNYLIGVQADGTIGKYAVPINSKNIDTFLTDDEVASHCTIHLSPLFSHDDDSIDIEHSAGVVCPLTQEEYELYKPYHSTQALRDINFYYKLEDGVLKQI